MYSGDCCRDWVGSTVADWEPGEHAVNIIDMMIETIVNLNFTGSILS